MWNNYNTTTKETFVERSFSEHLLRRERSRKSILPDEISLEISGIFSFAGKYVEEMRMFW